MSVRPAVFLLSRLIRFSLIMWYTDELIDGALIMVLISLHAGPVKDGDPQSLNEAAYPGYTRMTMPDSGGFEFPRCERWEGRTVLTHVGFGLSDAGPGSILASGHLSPRMEVVTGVIPTLTDRTEGFGLPMGPTLREKLEGLARSNPQPSR